MKVETPQIIWHSKDSKFADRVYSLDFQPGTSRLATAGADEFIHIWEITRETEWKLKILSRLFGHEKEVNCVRFSSTGGLLASGGQDDSLCIWSPTSEKQQVFFGQNPEDVLGFPEYWKRITIMRCMAPVISLCWSPDDFKVVVGTEDDRVTIWDVHTGKLLRQLDGHSHLVMGVSWDPRDQFIATQSSDQTVRLWRSKTAKTKKKAASTPRVSQKEGQDVDPGSGAVTVDRTEDVGKDRMVDGGGKEEASGVGADSSAKTGGPSVAESDSNAEAEDVQNQGTNRSADQCRDSKSDVKSWRLHYTIKYETNEGGLRSKQQGPSETEGVGNQDLVVGDCATPNHSRLSSSNSGGQKRRCLFLAESATTTFFRRLDWSPNGEILVVPTGQYLVNKSSGGGDKCRSGKPAGSDENAREGTGSDQILIPVSYVFLRDEYSYPAAVLPSPDGTTSSVRFNQVAFLPLEKEERSPQNPFSSYRVVPPDNQESWIFSSKTRAKQEIPRYIFSVITLAGTIYIYDTQHTHPLVAIRGLHFQGMNDASWSSDGHTLAVASSDGYITIVFFEDGELGQVLSGPKVSRSSSSVSPLKGDDLCDKNSKAPLSSQHNSDPPSSVNAQKTKETGPCFGQGQDENNNNTESEAVRLASKDDSLGCVEADNTENNHASFKAKRRINPTVLISYE